MEKEKRVVAPRLDEILGLKLKVLDDGFVRVVDYMGSDSAIVQAARVSYGEGTKKLHEDRGLINYLMRHNHTTPFEMCEIKLHIRTPMDCWRQWIRHRTANVNEYSTRYSIAIDSSQKTAVNEWRMQSTANKQGGDSYLNEGDGLKLSQAEQALQEQAKKVYQERLDLGVAREQARKDLPLSTYTESYWKIDLHNLFHFLLLRMDSHAQTEIRSYATVIGHEIVKKWCPMAWEAFIKYRLNAVTFSSVEMEIVSSLLSNDTHQAILIAQENGILPADTSIAKKNRERDELEVKLKRLKIAIPWIK